MHNTRGSNISMKAIRFHQYRGPEVLMHEDAPTPNPREGEILLRVCAAGVNPFDWKIRAGYVKDWFSHALPLILGVDVSGVVATVGLGVTAWKEGDEVYGRGDVNRDGAYAE
jgi:NADPH:quinone reductase-like Zn-dependent oxidoreductase